MATHPGKSLDSGWETLFRVVLGLAGSQGSLRERLGDAYVSGLDHLRPEHVPVDRELDLAEIRLRRASVRATAVGGDAAATAAVAVMSDDEARRLLEQIVALYGRVAEARGEQRAGRQAGARSARGA
jgi:hypothetical protein